MVSAAVTSAASAQLFRQAEGLKANISGKYEETTDHFSEEFVTRKNLQEIYKTILLSDLQYGLDRKVELELWNNAFKGHIDYLRQRLKEKKGSDKAELQAKLCFFIDASVGFYLQLLQEFCECYDLDLPFRAKAVNLGIIPDFKPIMHSKPKTSSCYYISQDCLVHLGDLARYRNDISQAESYYKLASAIVAVNGQPYNQLAIIETAKGDHLKAVFYYCKSALVQNPFPAAVSNLQKTLNQFCARQNLGLLSKSRCSNVDDFIALFLQFHGSIYLMLNIDKLNSLNERIQTDFEMFSEELSSDQLLSMTLVVIFTLHKNKPKEEDENEECIAEDEIKVWNLATKFAASIYNLFITLAQSHQTIDGKEENKFLPSIKVFSDWILCSGSSILLEKSFDRNKDLYKNLASLGNELLKRAGAITTATASPLPEDCDVRGFFPLRRIHRRLEFTYNDGNGKNMNSLRAYRIISFINWVCQQVPASRYIAKGESGGVARFIYLQQEAANDEKEAQFESKMSEKDFDLAVRKLFDTLPRLQPKAQSNRSKSPFRETKSLFRTDSEEQGIKDIPIVSGPVAPYSLFDSTWSVPFNRSPTKESPADDQSYPELFEKLAISHVTESSPISNVEQTTADIFPKSTRAVNIGVFPSSTTISNSVSRQSQLKRPQTMPPMGNQVPNHPIQQQQMARLPLKQPLLPPPSFYSNQPSNRMPMAGRIESSVHQNGVHATVFGSNAPPMNQHPLSFVGPVQHVPIPMTQNIPHHGNFSGGFVQPVVSSGAVFGAVGQTTRSHFQGNSFQNNYQPNTMNLTPPGSPKLAKKINQGNQSIWSSNYGFGHGAMSPLEQLLSDQKKNQKQKPK